MSRTITPSRSQARLILIGTALLLILGMGIRQSLGLFLTPVTHDLGISAADFTLALGVQNIVWGLSQAIVGAIADRFGLRITMIAGAAIYVVGLAIMAAAQGTIALIISGGLIGVALSCTAKRGRRNVHIRCRRFRCRRCSRPGPEAEEPAGQIHTLIVRSHPIHRKVASTELRQAMR
jgi:hypothetical protein